MVWTPADIPDQSGKIAIVTGAGGGLGMIAAGELARRGARVVLACRDTAKGERAAARMRAASPGADVEVTRLDLADLSSVREFAGAVSPYGVDILLNNAGVMAIPRMTTPDGFETQFGTNHLGHFALTGLLLPALLSRPAPRVVTVSSAMHRSGRIDFTDLHGERRYRKWRAYSQSKLANLLFMRELARRARGTGLISVAAHPGYAATGLQAVGPEMDGNRLAGLAVRLGNTLMAQSAEMGSLPLLYAATAPGIDSGSYAGPDGFMEQRGYPVLVGMSPAARDDEVARRLWDVSEELTGVRYAFAGPTDG
ncbi:SDR family oxidoreductase [Microbispora sp. RL4-1S]|uniref:SDR family oxidoreductase n=1 Tax=Microbispora oryzae TaxID=2806554 RepID=A0A941AJW8_9ACTN|nr:oxidoreductase [Microbispora oryzae]MBP2704608.1 SDR family oxidoreductase [Microbispora oryzae]